MENWPKLVFAVGLSNLWASAAAAERPSASAPTMMVAATSATAADANVVELEGGRAAEPAESADPESGWQFSTSPYLWMSRMKGDMGVVEQVEPVGVDLSFFDIVDAMKFALMGSFEARKGRFVGTGDALYLSMGASEDIEIRDEDFVDVELGSKTFISTMTAGYKVIDQDRVAADIFGGGRYYWMKVSLDLEGPERSFSGDKSESWFDPIIGARVQVSLAPNWSLKTYVDIGGFGIGSHLTWQVMGVVQYDLSKSWSLTAGWRHLDIDYDHEGFVFDATMGGPIVGAVYRF